ncbi:MAG: hypothetical protein JF589_11810 [Gemmatimonadetes bacterium]|nr:hypothetical protein [Gemmatimonadota bacterium]
MLVFALAAAGLAAAASAGVEAGVEGDEEVETTTVDDLTSVVVQPPGVVAALAEPWAGAVVLAEAAAGADVEPPALDGTFEPAGTAGDGGACLAAVIVVSRAAVMVVSRRTVADFDALRTLSVGRAGEADRAVAKRTCSIIAV